MGKGVVITGMGIVSAIGCDRHTVLQSLLHGVSGIGPMCHLPSSHHELPVGEVKLSNGEMQAMIAAEYPHLDNLTPTPSRTTLMGILAVGQAIRDARLQEADGRRVLLVSGTTVGGMDRTEQYFHTLAESDEHLDVMLTHDCGSCTKAIANGFPLIDDCTTLSTACSSAANALILGARMIQAGQADVVIAGGSEALTRFHLNGFNSLMIVDRERCRPFDDTRAGLNLGEGAAYVVMEREDAARHRGADIQAWLTGFGNACDAWHQTASSPNGEGAFRAMSEAIASAGITPADVDYVNAHGTATPDNDLAESIALQRVFGRELPPVSSTKSLTGHTTSASGAIETVICLLAMQHGFIPPNLGWQHPMAQGIIPTARLEHRTLRHVLCNSFGFGGNDSSLLFSAVQPEGSAACGTTAAVAQHADVHPSPLIREQARVEITSEDELAEVRRYVKPMELRRMGRLMKSCLLSSLKALEQAGIETPDAIVTATSLGCWENSELLLRQLHEEGEVMLRQTLFMQSTHNTLGSAIAIRTGCHGYNVTYAHGRESLEWAVRDAQLLLRSGKARTVLVGIHEESTPWYRDVQARLGNSESLPSIHSLAFVLTCGE